MSKYDIGPDFECQNRFFECQNTTFGPILNVRYDIECRNRIFVPSSNVKTGL